MNNKGVLNAKLKILIILAYTIILFLVVFLIFGRTKNNQFEEYKNVPYDEHMGVSVRLTEERKSLLETYNASDEKSKEAKKGLNEKATYSIQLTLFKFQVETIKEIAVNIVALTKDNQYKYASYSGTRSMSGGVYKSEFSFTSFSSKEVVEKKLGIGTKNYVFDETPKEVYVNVKYKIGTDSKEYVLKYGFKTMDIAEKKLSKYETRDVLSANANDMKNYINPSNDVLGIRIFQQQTGLKSTISNINKDKIEIFLIDIEKNIDNFMLSQSKVSEENLKAIELPSSNKDPLRPEITNMGLEIWGKIESSDKKFSSYIRLYTVYGFFSKYRELNIYTLEIDESLNLSDIFVTAKGTITNGTVDSFEMNYKVNLNDLPKFETKTE